MITILYTVYSNDIDIWRFNEYLKLLPVPMQQQIRQYKRKEDGYSCLLGKLLLREGLKKFSAREVSLEDLEYSKYTKPYFPSGFKFNISHSGRLVVCAVDLKNEIGIDVEQIVPVNLNDFSSQLTSLESIRIRQAEDQMKEFYKWWTKKESVAKADGRGLNIPLKNILFENSSEAQVYGKKWHLKPIDLHTDYCGHMACNEPFEDEIQSEQFYF